MQWSLLLMALTASLAVANPVDLESDDDGIWLNPEDFELEGMGADTNLTALFARADAPKINEYKGKNCGGELLYHHSPGVNTCVGISLRTKSVYLVNGLSESKFINVFTNRYQCGSGDGPPIHWDVDANNCFDVTKKKHRKRVQALQFGPAA